MKLLRTTIFIACFGAFATSSLPAMSATWKVDFWVPETSLTGILTFDELSEQNRSNIATDLEMTSNVLGEVSSGYELLVANFSFLDGRVQIQSFFAQRAADAGNVLHQIYFNIKDNYYGASCLDFIFGPPRIEGTGCNGTYMASERGDPVQFGLPERVDAPEVIPTPASLPLFLSGIAAFLGTIRQRRIQRKRQ